MGTNAEKLARAREELEDVRAAIKRVLWAEQYNTGSRGLRRPTLDTLYKRQDQLEADIERLENPGDRFRKVVPVFR